MRKSKPRSRPYLVLSTVGSFKEAEKIAAIVLKKRLCACVNIIKKTDSRFWWRGKIDRAKEVLLLIKTDGNQLRELEKTIVSYHSYDVPEIIGIPVVWGHVPYLEWLSDSVFPPKQSCFLL